MLMFKVMVCFLALFRTEDCVGGLPSADRDPSEHQRAASNQAVANEPGIEPTGRLDDYGNCSHKEAAAEVQQDRFELGDSPRHEFLRMVPATAQKHERNSSSPEIEPKKRFSSVYSQDVLEERVSREKTEFKNDLSAYLAGVIDSVVSGRGAKPEVEPEERDAKKVSRKRELKQMDTYAEAKDLDVLADRMDVDLEPENRQRKSVEVVVKTRHQQSTNMPPATRSRSVVYKKRSSRGEGNKGVRRNGGRVAERRDYSVDPVRFAVLNPVQINAAAAYGRRPQSVQLDLSQALGDLEPFQLQALRGFFDKVPPPSANFKPIAPKQVAYAPPRIVYETKILPMPFGSIDEERKTVEALNALLGQSPKQQLEGLNLILNKDQPVNHPQQELQDALDLGQAFVTPIPSADVNSGLAESGLGFPNGGLDFGEAGEAIFDLGTQQNPGTPGPEFTTPRSEPHQDRFKDIPVIQEHREQLTVFRKEHQQPEKQGGGILREGYQVREREESGEDTNSGVGYAAKYNFGYHVNDYKSGNDFGHEEARDGLVTNGRYCVLLPDGRVQNVKYRVDENGYHAKVSYELTRST
ncbi:uncharacterized protein LOC124186497 [Neodiprion fabricii]|uniref:uncharacterized protein LOC124186497 n=1 Tax=Neodiprion fabricii TaxID=2872261 RepID=UPI001ED8EE85|nr:uncharacterized protein LOC124186497 [Neodiprion fabricii]